MLLEYEKIGSSFVQKRDLSAINEDKIFKGSDYNHFLTVKWTFLTANEDSTMSCVPTLTIKRSDGVINGPIVCDAGSFVETVNGSSTTYSWTFSLTANDVARKGAIQLTPSFLYKATSSDLMQIKTSTTAIMTVFDAIVSGNNIIVLDESDIDTVVSNVQSSINSLTANFDNYYTKANTLKKYSVIDSGLTNTNLIALLNTLIEPDTVFIKWTQSGITYQLKVEITGENQNELRQTVTYIDTYVDDYSVITMQRTEDLTGLEAWTDSFTTTKFGYNSTKEKYYFQNEDGTIDYVNSALTFKAKANENITKGDVLQIVGTTGINITVKKAVYSEIVENPHLLIGFADETASANNNLKVKIIGNVEGLNTSALTEGSELFLSTSVAGGITTTKPTNGNIAISIGMCFRNHSTQGIISVAVKYSKNDKYNLTFESQAEFNAWIDGMEEPHIYSCNVKKSTLYSNCLVFINIITGPLIEQSIICFSSNGMDFQTRTFESGNPGEFATSFSLTALNTYFNNADTNLISEDVQNALVEINTKVNTNTSDISDLETNKLDKNPDGTNPLVDVNNKLNTYYIPDWIKGGSIYGGTVDASTGIATLSESAKGKLGTTSATITLTNDATAITGYVDNEAIMYRVSVAGTFSGINFVASDILISNGTTWEKVDTTDQVSSVNSKTGAVVLNAEDVGAVSTTNIANNLTTTVSGKVLDARQGKVLNDTFANYYIEKQAYFRDNTTNNYWYKIASFSTSTAEYNNYVLELLVSNACPSITNILGKLKINIRQNNDINNLIVYSINWLEKSKDTNLNYFALVNNGSNVELYAKSHSQNSGTIFKRLSEHNIGGLQINQYTFYQYALGAVGLTDAEFTALSGTKTYSTMMDNEVGNLKVNGTIGNGTYNQSLPESDGMLLNSNELELRGNLLNPETTTDGYYISQENGNLYANAPYSASDYIPVSASTIYCWNFSWVQGAWYDSNKSYLSACSGASGYATSPATAAYLRVSLILTSKYLSAVYEGQYPLQEYRAYGKSLVYSENNPQIVEIIVDASGSGNYTSLITAIASITDSYAGKIYNVYIKPGTYDTVDSTNINVIGLLLPNYVNLIGVGDRTAIILQTGMASGDLTLSRVKNISVINAKYNNNLENLTLNAVDCRYAVHDDSSNSFKNYNQHIKNCVFNHFGYTTSYTFSTPASWGQGTSSGGITEFDNCEFNGYNEGYYAHDNSSFTKPSFVKFNNCSFRAVSNSYGISVLLDSMGTTGIVNQFIFNNSCFNSQLIYFAADVGTIKISGSGNSDFALYTAGTDYEKGFYDKTEKLHNNSGSSISAFTPIKLSSLGNIVAMTGSEIALFYGIVLGTVADGDDVLVLKKGSIKSSYAGITATAGQRYTITSGALAVTTGSDYVALCKIDGYLEFV